MSLKICAYVQEEYAKANYKNECLDTRQFVGLRVIIDCLERAGYTVEYAGVASVHRYDIVLVSITSDCDWWPFIRERLSWQKGSYKVLVGGAGVLHISPFLPFFDAAMFGRGESLIVPLVQSYETGNRYTHESIAYSDDFSPERIYRVCQTGQGYPFPVPMSGGKTFCETTIGCNHKCLFCGYTWQRRFISPDKFYHMDDALFGGIADKERAMLDMAADFGAVDWAHLRTTAIDGFSQRLRYMVNKKISRDCLLDFLSHMLRYPGKAHQLKFYNICGYPTETMDDWAEFSDTLRAADTAAPRRDTQWSIVLHSTPFRPMPATPMACAPASLRSYRGAIGRELGKGLKGGLIYQGQSLWSVESMGTDSLSSVMLSMLAHRGRPADCENIAKLCRAKAFWSAGSAVKEATISRYFDVDALFREYTPETLPSRYLRSYAELERMWDKPCWRKEAAT